MREHLRHDPYPGPSRRRARAGRAFTLSAAALTAAACSSTTGPLAPGAVPPPLPGVFAAALTGSLADSLAGTASYMEAADSSRPATKSRLVSLEDTTHRVTVTVLWTDSLGTPAGDHPIGPDSTQASASVFTGGGSTAADVYDGTSGTITVTGSDGVHLTGRFSFVARQLADSTAEIRASGTFTALIVHPPGT